MIPAFQVFWVTAFTTLYDGHEIEIQLVDECMNSKSWAERVSSSMSN